MRSYKAYIGWAGRNAGVARVGSAKVAPAVNSLGYDRIGFDFTPTYTGLYDDVSGTARYMATDFTVTRKMGEDHIGETKIDLILNDVWPGRYNNKNPASPLYGLIRPMRPAKVQGSVDGVLFYDLGHGWLEEGEDDPDIGVNQARFQFRDLTTWLESEKNIVIPATGMIYVGQAIGLILDYIGWTNPALRSLQNGELLPDFEATGDKDGRQIISELLKVDLGWFYHSRQNVATYVDRYERARRTSLGTFQSAKAAIPGVSLASVKNRAISLKTGSIEQTYSDDPSDAEFGTRDHDKVESVYFRDDAQALRHARARVSQTKEPSSPFWVFDVSEGPTGYLEAILQGEFLDPCIIDTVGLNAESFSIKDMTHRGRAGALHHTAWVLEEVTGPQAALVGRATVAPNDPLLWGGYARVVF